MRVPVDAARRIDFWGMTCFCSVGIILPSASSYVVICGLVQELDAANRFVDLYRAVSFGQLGEFPRASVAFEDALVDDPIDLLAKGQQAIETVLTAAVKCGRIRDFVDILDKKAWKDGWRPIYEALRSVESGSAQYLKRTAVEFRAPALDILRRIAPDLRDMPERTT